MRLIDEDALIALINKRLKNSVIIGWLCSIIGEVPTIEARPVVRGEWENHGMYMICPVCGAEFDDDIVNMCRDEEKSAVNFCGHCGADLRGE